MTLKVDKITESAFKLKRDLAAGRLTLGSWITLGHPAIAEIFSNAGFDWLAIDLEHSAISIREAEDLIRVSTLSNVPTFVRLTSNEDNQIKRVMDAGASGIIVPMVNSRVDAERAVSAVNYSPVGCRGVGLARAQGYGSSFDSYRKWLCESGAIVIAMIEHIDAVKNLREILAVEGIDGCFIGPYDLSASMGLSGQLDHPEVITVIAEILATAKALRKPGGIHIIEPIPEKLRGYVKNGFTFIAYSLDIRMLDISARLAVDLVNGERD